jgi:hypothetical protein
VTSSDAAAAADIWAQTIAATSYLADGSRPGLSVWDALEEAVRWWTAAMASDGETTDPDDLPWNDPDPLRTSLDDLMLRVGPAGAPGGHRLSDALTTALRSWLSEMSDRYNDGAPFIGRADEFRVNRHIS